MMLRRTELVFMWKSQRTTQNGTQNVKTHNKAMIYIQLVPKNKQHILNR